MPEKPIGNSSLVRVAGNIASGLLARQAVNRDIGEDELRRVGAQSVALALIIVGLVEARGTKEAI